MFDLDNRGGGTLSFGCHSEKQRKIAENRVTKSCDSSDRKIGLSVGKGCRLLKATKKSYYNMYGLLKD